MVGSLFSLEGLTPHGFCLSWRPDLFWTMAVADGGIAVSYVSIGAAILAFLHRRTRMQMRWVGWLLAAAFILCGLSHAMDVLTLWRPDYALQALEKAVTAISSVFTAVLLWPLLPKALRIPTAAELEAIIEQRTHDLQIKTELLSQSNADLEQFAYVASHDLQTPLRSMVNYSQLLERRYGDTLADDAKEFLGFIVESGKHMSLLIQDLLQYARVTSQSSPLETVSAAEAFEQAVAALRADVDAAGGDVVAGPLPEVMAEPARLVSLLQNLIGNAVKYRHPDRRPVVRVAAVRLSPELWRFQVADNGIGVEPQYFDKIFEIFQRLEAGGPAEGSGIGLALCRRIVNRFGGTIWLESAPGEGATFFFTLKAVDKSAPC